MHQAILSLGSNLGYRKYFLAQARRMIANEVGPIIKQSSLYETSAWGFHAPDFINQVIVVQTSLTPFQLLETTQTIEKKLGRRHKSSSENGKPTYQSRTIDIDILYFDNINIQHEKLVIPHPEIEKRDFILKPLHELNIPFPIN